MNVEEAISKARDAITVRRVYGEPYERDGVTVIPAAAVGGGAGGGSGEQPGEVGGADRPPGGGYGFGLGARPVGAFVIEDGLVRWEPAYDVTRIATQALVALVTLVLLVARRR